jgi:hypothetical protein
MDKENHRAYNPDGFLLSLFENKIANVEHPGGCMIGTSDLNKYHVQILTIKWGLAFSG